MASAKLTLTSNAVAYNLFTLAKVQVANWPASPSELNITLPDATVEAGNAGAIVKIGRPDSISVPTDVTGPERSLTEGDSTRYAPSQGRVDGMNKWLKASTNNAVLYVSVDGG